jgi:hypothetical protein
MGVKSPEWRQKVPKFPRTLFPVGSLERGWVDNDMGAKLRRGGGSLSGMGPSSPCQVTCFPSSARAAGSFNPHSCPRSDCSPYLPSEPSPRSFNPHSCPRSDVFLARPLPRRWGRFNPHSRARSDISRSSPYGVDAEGFNPHSYARSDRRARAALSSRLTPPLPWHGVSIRTPARGMTLHLSTCQTTII